MAGMGQEERFPPTRLNAGYGFRKETIAGMRRTGRDAPIPRLPGFASLRGSDGSIHKKAHELHDSRIHLVAPSPCLTNCSLVPRWL